MHNPKVSIITPVLNGKGHIEHTIRSVLSQGYPNLEYIIIDGGSTDGTLDIIKKYEKHIAYWESKPDKGISDAFNKGIKKATGEIVGIINADDWYEAITLKTIANYCCTNPEFDIFYGQSQFSSGTLKKPTPNSPLAHIYLLHTMSLNHPSVFVKRELYQKIGVFELKYKLAMDYDFLLRSLLAGAKFKFINIHLANFRAGGVSMRFYSKALEECEMIKRILFSEYKI